MNKSRFLTFFLILTIWLSTAGFTPLQTTANALAPAVSLAPASFGKTSPGNNTTVTTSQVTLTWQTSTGAASYQYCIFSKTICPPGQWKSVGSSTSVTVTLKPSVTYFWQVRAIAADSTMTSADAGVAWKFITGSAAPQTFGKISPANGATNQPINPTLSWQASTGLNVNYQVCVDTVDNKPAPVCDTNWVQVGAVTSYTLSGLDYNKDYYWQVRAYNSRGVVYANGINTWWKFTTRIAPPTPFMKLTPEDGAANMPVNLSLSWSPSTGSNITYQYCLIMTNTNPGINSCVDSGGTWSTATINTSADLTGLTHGKTYYWQVRSLNNNDQNDFTLANSGAWWSFNTIVTDPLVFAKLFPDDNALDVSITPYLYWSVAEGNNVKYEICYKPGLGATCDPLVPADWTQVSGTNTYIKLPELLRDTLYTWQVRAQAAGVSGYTYADGETVFRHFTTIPVAPVANPLAQSFTTPEDTPLTGGMLTASATNRTLTFTLSGHEPASKVFSLSSTGQITFTPLQDFNGTVTFSYTIWDGVNLPTGPYTATINVTEVNDKPTIDPVADVTVFTGGDIFFTVQTSDADLQYGDTLTISLIGTLPTGAVFTPFKNADTGAVSADFEWFGALWAPTHSGPYAFTVRVTDSKGEYAEDAFTVTVTANQLFLPILAK